MRPRIRSIKPEAVKDPELWDAEVESGLPLFRAFVGLWCCADREGRFEWKPRELKLECLPWWDGDFSRVLDALTTRGFLVMYLHEGRRYGFVRSFMKHQSINNRESESALPEPTEESIKAATCERVDDASASRHGPAEGVTSLPFPSLKGGVGGETIAPKPPKGSRKKPLTPFPEGWKPNEQHAEHAKELNLNLAVEARTFENGALSKDRRYANWDRAFHNWLDNSPKFSPSGQQQKPQQTEWEGVEKWV